MKRSDSSSFHGKTFVVLIVCLGIPLIATLYVVQYISRNVFFEQITYLLMAAIVTVFVRQLMRTEKKSRDTVEEAAREVRRVDGLMLIVNKAVASLLSADENSFEDAQQNCMEMMMEAMEVDRLLILRRDAAADGMAFRLAASCQNETGRSHNYIDFENGKLPEAADWADWVERMKNSQIVTRFRSKMDEDGVRWLDSFGICSITTVPVFLQDDFWGFVTFSNCHKERGFSKDEEAILLSGSMLMANAIARNEMMHGLVLAREEALAGTRAKSAFLAGMSHEMRTPMNAIIGMTTIGRAANDLARKNYAFGKIMDASSHLLGVINDVLDISKIESGKLEISPVEFAFEDMLKRVVNVTDERFAEKEQTFFVRLDETIPATLVCDDQRLTQIITNLLSNAVKFTPRKGSIRMDATLLAEDEGVCTIRIDVSDNGIGLNAEQQKRVFHSFEQAENSTTRKYGGTGLGLSISKNLVERMGGEIWVRSEEGRGSTFSFTVRAPAGAIRKSSHMPPGVDWKRFRVLLADDDAAVREYFAHIVELLGPRCDTAANADEALGKIREAGSYDLCFIDWRMPDADGLELARTIKGANAGQKVVLLASATEWDRMFGDADTTGADRFLPKPLFPSSVAACISECLTPERRPADDDANQAGSADDYAGRTILLAEDVEINREILLGLLEYTGITIDCACDGAQAVRMFSENPGRYGMIFMDVQMPEMDGYDATRAIRAMSAGRARNVPIVAMTANVFREDIEACRKAGMDDHVGKPLSREDVLEKLRRYLR